MNKKILFITNISGKRIGSFSIASIEAAKANSIEFHMAANFNASNKEDMLEDEKKYGIKLHHIAFARNPIDKENKLAYKQLVRLMETENFDLVHCNTPVGGFYGRLAAKKTKITKVIYQVHGFHFYKGAPKLNWIIYYPVEKMLAHITDTLITINKEDYALAKKKIKLRNNGEIYYVPGVGIDIYEYRNENFDKNEFRQSLGFSESDIIAVSVGRLDKNKNNETLVKAISLLDNKNIKLAICGDGEERQNLRELVRKLNIEDRVKFLGIRNDMKYIYHCSDVFLMASFREGLSRSIMEAMACGLPCVVSDIRGNGDLITDRQGGYLISPLDVKNYADKISLLEEKHAREDMKKYNMEYIENFSVEKIVEQMIKIYSIFK